MPFEVVPIVTVITVLLASHWEPDLSILIVWSVEPLPGVMISVVAQWELLQDPLVVVEVETSVAVIPFKSNPPFATVSVTSGKPSLLVVVVASLSLGMVIKMSPPSGTLLARVNWIVKIPDCVATIRSVAWGVETKAGEMVNWSPFDPSVPTTS